MLEKFTNLSVEQKLIGVNAVIFTLVAVFAMLMIVAQRVVTAEPPITEITAIIEGNTTIQTNQQERPDPAPKFGVEPIFDTLITLPTPTPTPEPTQAPDPPLEDAIKSWKILSVYKTEATVTDIRTRDTFLMYTTETDSTKMVRHRNTDMEIKLESINDDDFTATFRYDGPAGVQRFTKGMFDKPSE